MPIDNTIRDRFLASIDSQGLPAKDWDRLFFRAGLGLQQAELNELVSVIDFYLGRLGQVLFNEGDRVSGAHIGLNTTAGTVSVDDGIFFVQKKVRFVPGATVLAYAGVEYKVGISVTEELLDELDDPDLLDPATGADNQGLPGALRRKVVVTWASAPSTTTPLPLLPIYTVDASGNIKGIDETPELSNILSILEPRTFDESGHYKVFGFNAYFDRISGDDEHLSLRIDTGRAYVLGRRIEQLGGNLTFDKAVDTTTDRDVITVLEKTVKTAENDVVSSTNTQVVNQSVGGAPWSLPNLVRVSDRHFAVSFIDGTALAGMVGASYNYSDVLLLKHLGIQLGSTSATSIKGIEVVMKRSQVSATATISDKLVRFSLDGGLNFVGENRAKINDVWDSSKTNATYLGIEEVVYGGPTDLWGRSWTIGEIVSQDLTLGVQFQRNETGQAATALLDSITVRVYYNSGDAEKVYRLEKSHVASVTKVECQAQTPYMAITRQAVNDNLPQQSVEYGLGVAGSKYQVITGGVTLYKDSALSLPYTQGVHYNVGAGDSITWLSTVTSPAIPAIGATYYGYWNYDTENGTGLVSMVRGSRVRTVVNHDGKYFTADAFGRSFNFSVIDEYTLGFSPPPGSRTDVFKLNRVYEGPYDSPTTIYTEGVDYLLETGRADHFLGLSYIQWLTNGSRPSPGTLYYTDYEYWDHQVEGDFVTGDSYLDTDGTSRAERSDVELTEANSSLSTIKDIADSIDFRPLVVPGIGGAYDPEASPEDLTLYPGINKRGTSVIGSPVTVDYTAFLPRNDVLTLDRDSNFHIVKGQSSSSPKYPQISESQLPLFYIASEPNDNTPKLSDTGYTRYTMADIQHLARRVEYLESHLLETILTRDLNVDPNLVNGLKRGIFTDPVHDFSRAQLDYSAQVSGAAPGGGSIFYKAAVHPLAGSGRMPFVVREPSVEASESISGGTAYEGDHLILIDATSKLEISQRFATYQHRVNRGGRFGKVNDVVLSPSSDSWIDLDQEPRVIIPVDEVRTAGSLSAALPQFFVNDKQIPRLLTEKLYNWWVEFLFGVPSGDTVTPVQLNTRSFNQVDETGKPISGIQQSSRLGVESFPSVGAGFVPIASRIRNRRLLERINEYVLAKDLVPYARPRTVNVTGTLFPASVDITGKFGNKTVALSPTSPSISGATSGSVQTNVSGAFAASFTIPSGVPNGVLQFEAVASSGTPTFAGPSGPTHVVNDNSVGVAAWTNLSSLFSEDAPFPTQASNQTSVTLQNGQVSKYLKTSAHISNPTGALNPLVGFHGAVEFDIPASAIIQGIEVLVKRRRKIPNFSGTLPYTSAPGSVKDYQLRLVKAGTIVGDDLGRGDLEWPSLVFEWATYGSSSELWGASWTPADINHPEFGVALSVIGQNGLQTAEVDHIQIIVHYLDGINSVGTTLGRASYVAQAQSQRTHPTFASLMTTVNDASTTSVVPTAQSFSVDRDCYVKAVDLFFSSKDSVRGILVEIRDMQNGLPGTHILAKKYVTPSEIVIGTNNHIVPTRITFSDPAFIRNKEEYCIAIAADSTAYSMFAARMADKDLNSNTLITKQPAAGLFFYSVNTRTWAIDSNVDLTFNLYTLDYSASVSATLTFDAFTFPESSSLVLLVNQMLATSTAINWEVTINSSDWLPIVPGQALNFSQTFSIAQLRATLSGSGLSPAINKDSIYLFAVASDGTLDDTDRVADHISNNNVLSSTFNTLKMSVDQYVPPGTSIQAFYSTTNGASWVEFNQAVGTEPSNGVSNVTYSTKVMALKNNSPYLAGDIVAPGLNSGADPSSEVGRTGGAGFYFLATTSGTTGSTTPPLHSTLGATVTDGTVVWQCLGSYPWTQFMIRMRMVSSNRAYSPQFANLNFVALDV